MRMHIAYLIVGRSKVESMGRGNLHSQSIMRTHMYIDMSFYACRSTRIIAKLVILSQAALDIHEHLYKMARFAAMKAHAMWQGDLF